MPMFEMGVWVDDESDALDDDDALASSDALIGAEQHAERDAVQLNLAVDNLVLPPGQGCLHAQLAQPDPLVGLGSYGFPCFTHGQADGVLVDTDGDGVMDETLWGTPVTQVESYTREDGTRVEGHYRTHPDGEEWNNLRRR